jgi:hypothetical protein
MFREQQYRELAETITAAMRWEFWSLECLSFIFIYLLAPAYGGQFLVSIELSLM